MNFKYSISFSFSFSHLKGDYLLKSLVANLWDFQFLLEYFLFILFHFTFHISQINNIIFKYSISFSFSFSNLKVDLYSSLIFENSWDFQFLLGYFLSISYFTFHISQINNIIFKYFISFSFSFSFSFSNLKVDFHTNSIVVDLWDFQFLLEYFLFISHFTFHK